MIASCASLLLGPGEKKASRCSLPVHPSFLLRRHSLQDDFGVESCQSLLSVHFARLVLGEDHLLVGHVPQPDVVLVLG